MADSVTANLPSRDLDKTAAFHGGLGLVVGFKDGGWMILSFGGSELLTHTGNGAISSEGGC